MRPGIGGSVVLWRFDDAADTATIAARLGGSAPLGVYRAREGDETCVYASSTTVEPNGVGGTDAPTRLVCVQQAAGASDGEPAPWHYVVDTAVLPEAEADFNAWYEQEHLPGLASVPGTVLALRFRYAGPSGPRYHACYDLVSLETFGSPPWLVVRGTTWSSRVRPSFRDTRRTMYRRLDVSVPASPNLPEPQ